MENNAKRIVCVGLGYWGKNVARNLYEIGALYGICEIDKSNPLIKQYTEKGIRFYENYEDVLSDESIDAVAIATPAVTHFELAKKSLIAGKDVFVEKPMALRVSDAKELVQIASHNKKSLWSDMFCNITQL